MSVHNFNTKAKPQTDRAIPIRGLKELRGLSDYKLLTVFYDEPCNRAKARQVINERMLMDGFVDFVLWVKDLPSPKFKEKKKEEPEPEPEPASYQLPKKIIATPAGEPLKEELKAIHETGFDFEVPGVKFPDECVSFCSEGGHVWNKTEEQLTPPQQRLLGLIRTRIKRYLDQNAQ